MIRTQVSLTDKQMAGLRRLARQRQISLAAALRDAVDDALERDHCRTQRARALRAIASLPAGGPSDLAEAHDRHLGEIGG